MEELLICAGFRSTTEALRVLTQHVHSVLPRPPVDTAAHLSFAAAASAPDGVDRISRLPDFILRNVVSRLPAKDAARTTLLSHRWRRVWSSAPLVLVDAHLLPPAVVRRYHEVDLVAGVSHALASHPGPLQCVYLTRTTMEDVQPAEIANWVQLLASKGVRDLVCVNRARRLHSDLELPAAIYQCKHLSRMYLGFWTLPKTTTATLPPAPWFPYLRELGLCSVNMDDRDLAILLQQCPSLGKLLIIANRKPLRVAICSPSLECLELCTAIVPDIQLRDAPQLRRLLLWHPCGGKGLTCMSQTVRVSVARNLRIMGFLVPGMHQLEIGFTQIKFQTQPRPCTMVPSVEMLALQVKLGTRKEATMLPAFLRCFPNVKTLYVQSEIDDKPLPSAASGVMLGNNFWKKLASPIPCIEEQVRRLVFREFCGKRSELCFLKFIAKHAHALESMEVFFTAGAAATHQEMALKLQSDMASAKWASSRAILSCHPSPFCDEGTPWCFQRAFDLSIEDPFDVTKCLSGRCLEN